jgi:hypothetical protein
LPLRARNGRNIGPQPAFIEIEEERRGPAEPRRPGRPVMAEDAEFLRAQAEKCRWLAARIAASDVAQTLRAMAKDYDARAALIEGETDA